MLTQVEGFFMDMKELKKDNIEQELKKQKEYHDNLSPEEKELLRKNTEEATKLLEHCKIKTKFGYNYDSGKVDIEKFLFLQNPDLNKSVNEVLIRLLSFISSGNIFLRYLLIEAGLKDKRIENILRKLIIDGKRNFYQISNNPQKFYDERYFKKDNDLILSTSEIDFYLNKYGLFKPAEISKIIVLEKVENILEEGCEQFIRRLSSSFEREINEVFLKEEKNLTAPSFFISMKIVLKKYFKESIENQLSYPNENNYSSFFISYLNEMFWLNEEILEKSLNIYFYIPNFLLTIAESEKQVAKLVADYSNKINKELEDKNKQNEDLQNFVKNFKGGKLSKDKVIMYKKVFERMDLKRQGGMNPKWTDIFNWVTKEKDSDGNPLISDEKDRERMKKSFLNWRGTNKINSLNQFLTYLDKTP